MKLVTRLVLAGSLAASFAVTAAPATANDCSNPKNPCGGCHVDTGALREITVGGPVSPTDFVRCYPV